MSHEENIAHRKRRVNFCTTYVTFSSCYFLFYIFARILMCVIFLECFFSARFLPAYHLKHQKLEDISFQLLYFLSYLALLECFDKEALLITMQKWPFRKKCKKYMKSNCYKILGEISSNLHCNDSLYI